MAQPGDAEEVLRFWFGDLDERGRADPEQETRWWRPDPGFDQLIRDRFGAVHAAVLAGELDVWLTSPRGRLACIVVLDQFSRNMFRGTARMFAADGAALAAAQGGIELGMDRGLAHDERSFFYMPFMHCEELAVQERCVELFAAWQAELDGDERDHVARMMPFAVQHRDIVERFGRFPHRNALLGRPSTPEELAFLTQPGSSF
jgi:uncharacterized protein (DUF924 family)